MSCDMKVSFCVSILHALEITLEALEDWYDDDQEKTDVIIDVLTAVRVSITLIEEKAFREAKAKMASQLDNVKTMKNFPGTPLVRSVVTAAAKDFNVIYQNGLDELIKICRRAGPPCFLFTGSDMMRYLTMTPKAIALSDPQYEGICTILENPRFFGWVQAMTTGVAEKWKGHHVSCVYCHESIPHCDLAGTKYKGCCSYLNCVANKDAATIYRGREVLNLSELQCALINVFKFFLFRVDANFAGIEYTFDFPSEDDLKYDYPILEPIFLREFVKTQDPMMPNIMPDEDSLPSSGIQDSLPSSGMHFV